MHACSQRNIIEIQISNDDGDGGGDRPKIFVDREERRRRWEKESKKRCWVVCCCPFLFLVFGFWFLFFCRTRLCRMR